MEVGNSIIGNIRVNEGDGLVKKSKNNDLANFKSLGVVSKPMQSVLSSLEEYIQNDNQDFRKIKTIEFFVKDFCNVLGITKTQFAAYLEIDISNLNKYLKGQRTLNIELAMKLSCFFNIPTDVLLKLQLKNDLISLRRKEKFSGKYDKYDYKKVLDSFNG